MRTCNIKHQTHSHQAAQQGIVLLEALIAVLLFSMGVLALVGLQAAMMKNNADSKVRSDASYLAQQIIGQMWTNPTNIAAFAVTNGNIPTLPNGTQTIAIVGTNPAAVTITLRWTEPGQEPHSFITTANISP
ncbi:MAG: prepilin-type cleavage/methylation domain-containing protein [Gallionella sp.]|nr:prepilin-type cleavage/methylation domain-containing protein [Gallionella sp.]